MGFNKKFFTTGGIVASSPAAAAFDPLQNFETVTYTGNGGTQKITGYIRKGGAFNGSSSYIQSTSLGSNFAGNNTISVSLWFRSTTDSHQSLFNFSATGDASTEMGLRIRGDVTGDQIGIFNRNNGTYNIEANNTGTGSVIDGDWHHVVLTGNSSGHKLYFDGSELTSIVYQTGSSSTTLSIPSDINSFSIGANIDSSGAETLLNGQIDQVRVFNKAISSSEVTTLYGETYASSTKSTTDIFGDGSGVALYELDENANDTGGTYNGTATNVNYLGMAFQPDLVWIKNRFGYGHNHNLIDSVRGASNKLFSNLTNAEVTTGGLASFDSNGFSFDSSSGNDINEVNFDFVAWCWKAGGVPTPNNNTQGTITSTVSANPDAGFSIVKWTSTGSVATVGHGLSSAPEMIITKPTSSTGDWATYHTGIGNTAGIYLNLTNALITSSNFWNNTSPTSSVMTMGAGIAPTGVDLIAYCFHSVDGYQKIGSYSGGSTSTISTGFKPRFIIVKRTNRSGDDWHLFDSIREGADSTDKILKPNTSDSEGNGGADRTVNFTSDGFNWTNANSNAVNASGGEYIYLAIA